MRVTQVIGPPVGKSSLEPKQPGKRSRAGGDPDRPTSGSGWLTPAGTSPRAGAALVITYKDIEDRLRRDRGCRGRPLRSHRGHRPLAECRRADHHRPAAAAPARHRTHGGRHYRQAGHRRARWSSKTRQILRAWELICKRLRHAGSRDGPAGGHRGGHRAGRRAGAGRQPDGGQPGRGLPDPGRHRGARPARSTRWSNLPTSSPTPSTT